MSEAVVTKTKNGFEILKCARKIFFGHGRRKASKKGSAVADPRIVGGGLIYSGVAKK